MSWYVNCTEGNPTRKTFAMWKIGEGNHKKAWKQEIRREHNSNPLRHEHVQCIVYRLCSRSIYQLPSTTAPVRSVHVIRACYYAWMDCVYLWLHVLGTSIQYKSSWLYACIINIQGLHGHHSTRKLRGIIIGWENMENYQYTCDWRCNGLALVWFLVSTLFCGSPGQS